MEGFGPLSEMTRDMTPKDRAEVDAIKAEMQREENRRAARGAATPGARGPESAKAITAAANRPDITGRDGGRRGKLKPQPDGRYRLDLIGAAVVLLAEIGAPFRSLRGEMRAQRDETRDMRNRTDAQGEDLREQMGQLRERMEGLLEGLREAITGKRVA
jgi:hypothetical protein